MTRSAWIIGLLCATVASAPEARAQDLPKQVRFITADFTGEHRWRGRLERLTPDSLELRVSGADTIAAFSRTAVRFAERQHLALSPGRAAGVGCLTVGAALGAVGFLGPNHSGDYSGLKNIAGVFGLVAGCGVGAVGGLLVSAARGQRWEPWLLPVSSPSSTVPPNER